MKMRRVENYDELLAHVDRAEVGEPLQEIVFLILPEGAGKRIVYQCPLGHFLCGVPFKPMTLPNGATWEFDGDHDAPTLRPSINCVGGCGWHGFITKGDLTNA